MVSTHATNETSLYTKIQIEPSNECFMSDQSLAKVWWKQNALIGPDYISIKYDAVNHTLSDSEVQSCDDECQNYSCCSKEDEQGEIFIIGAVDAV